MDSPSPETPAPDTAADVTVIIVSYNTRELTLKAIETLYATTRATRIRTVLYDNDSKDGSAEAVAAAFPQVEVVASKDNLGFAKANNVVAAQADTEWILLLNPDTECHEGAVDEIVAFGRAHPEAGAIGGRTYFPDGSLNPLSVQGEITLWSSFCRAVGLTIVFKRSAFFNPEAYGDWPRDTEREVDCIVGCFLLMRRALWDRLGGFDLRYYMYGEDSDLSLRARAAGHPNMIAPKARIMHLVGASSTQKANKVVMVALSRATLIRDHWPAWKIPFGIATLWLWGALRTGVAKAIAPLQGDRGRARAEHWNHVWSKRREWLAGY